MDINGKKISKQKRPNSPPYHHITHLPSLEKPGYKSYSVGIQNASRMSLVFIRVHSLSSSKPFKFSVSSHCTMSQLKSNSQYSFTQQSQGCLAFMLESIFSGHHPWLPSEYSWYPFNVSDKFPGILNGFYIHLQHPPSTQHMCSSLMLIHPLPLKYEIHPSFSPSLIVLWVLLMAPTSSVEIELAHLS